MVSREEYMKVLKDFLDAEEAFNKLVMKHSAFAWEGQENEKPVVLDGKAIEQLKEAQLKRDEAKKKLDTLDTPKQTAGAWGR